MNAWPLLSAALVMGAAGSPHCALMCAAPCAAAARGCGPGARPAVALQVARVAGYATAGGAVGAGISALRAASGLAAVLQPLWVLAQAGMLAVGLWILASGRLPTLAWSRQTPPTIRVSPSLSGAAAPPATIGWQRMSGPVRAGAIGAGWILLPCGLSQAALLLAALGDGPVLGAAVMAVFALASMPGLVLLPLAWRRFAAKSRQATWTTRAAGAGLALAAAWALGHGLGSRIAELCAK
jgi:sulfite exporter TauE/SafE